MSTQRSTRTFARTIVDGLLACALIVVVVQVTLSAARWSEARAQLRIVEQEAVELYRALDRYQERNGLFPPSAGQARLNRETLDPLRRTGYYEGTLADKLLDGKIDGYYAVGAVEGDPEFWIELTPSADLGTRYIVARSDDAPSGSGRWLDGVYRLRDGKLSSIR